MITITPKALSLAADLIRVWEGYRSVAYRDTGGVWTIGYGHTQDVSVCMICSRTQADAWLAEDMQKAAFVVGAEVNRPLTDHQCAALIDFAYNVGPGAFEKSTLLLQVNRGNFADVPHQISRWNKDHSGNVVPGLVKRRSAEVLLWNTPDAIPQVSTLGAAS